MKCLRCGSENQESSKFCLGCGSPLVQATPQPTQQQPVYQQQPMYQQPVYQQQPKKSKKGLIIGLSVGGGILLLIIIGLVLVFNIIKGAKKGLDNIEIEWGDGVTIITDDEDDIEDEISKNETYKYEIGNAVTLVDGSKWHVISNSDGETVTLMSDTLAVEEIGYGNSASREDQQYSNSKVKEYLEGTYKTNLVNSLSSNNGDISNLVVRTLTLDDLYTNTIFKESDFGRFCRDRMDIDDYVESYCLDEEGNIQPNYIWGDEVLTDTNKFLAILGMTKSFWMANSTTDRNCEKEYGLDYYGAYYVNTYGGPSTNEFTKPISYYSAITIGPDTNGVQTSNNIYATNRSTNVGIRPVIETSIKNIK